MVLYEVNWLAILVATVAVFILGFLWYGSLFGKAWMKIANISKADMKKAKKKGMMTGMIWGFITTFIIAYFLGWIISLAGVTTIGAAALVSFWVWLGFVGTVTLGGVLWKGEKCGLWVLNNAYNIVEFVIIGMILVAWP